MPATPPGAVVLLVPGLTAARGGFSKPRDLCPTLLVAFLVQPWASLSTACHTVSPL